MKENIPMKSSFFHTLFIGALIVCVGVSSPIQAQRATGFMPLNRLGVSYQKAVGVDLGFGAYNLLFGRQLTHFFDISLGSEAVFANQLILVPKVNADIGFDIIEAMTFGGGIDAGWHTDFSQGTWRFSPKAGFTAGSVIRLYYARHLYGNPQQFAHIGQHRISLEVNIAAFHNVKIGF